jgi:hypothetical protein
LRGVKVADIMAILGSVDVIMGSVDRWLGYRYWENVAHRLMCHFFCLYSCLQLR